MKECCEKVDIKCQWMRFVVIFVLTICIIPFFIDGVRCCRGLLSGSHARQPVAMPNQIKDRQRRGANDTRRD